MNLNITYTPKYEGCHKIFFKGPDMEEYCYYQDDFYCIINEPKTVTINFDNDKCIAEYIQSFECFQTVTLVGYIQPCCFSNESVEGRVPFTASAIVTVVDGNPCEIV